MKGLLQHLINFMKTMPGTIKITSGFKYSKKSERKRITAEQRYKMWLDSFYNMRSELKFKGYELNLIRELNKPSSRIIIKELVTGKEYECHISDIFGASTDNFIEYIKSAKSITLFL